MNVTFPFNEQLYGAWESAKGYLSDGLTTLGSSIAAGYHTQHNTDDTHGTITASGPISERGRTTPMGEWINVPFDATDFTIAGAGNSWAVDAPTPGASFFVISYALIGTTMVLNLDIPRSNLTITVGVSLVTVNLPPGFRVAGNHTPGAYIGRTHYGRCEIVNGGTATSGFISAAAGDTTIGIEKADIASYVSDAAHGFLVRGQVFLEVEAV